MTQKERTRRAIPLMLGSLGAYGFAFLQPVIGAKLGISENCIAMAVLIWILAGAASACAYGTLPEAEISPENLRELQEMIDQRKCNL